MSDVGSVFAVRVVPATNQSTTTSSLVLQVTYVGSKSLSGFVVTVRMPTELVLTCVGPGDVVLTVSLQSKVLLVDTDAVTHGVGTASTVVSAVAAAPGSVVRGGILSSLSSLLSCEAPDLTQPLSLLANPFNIALGRAEGQYYRGGILSGLLLLMLLSLMFCGMMVPGKMASLRAEYGADGSGVDGPPPTWGDAVAQSYLPGLLIAPMAIVGESLIPDGTTLVSMPDADTGDILLGVVAIGAFMVYVGHLLVTSIRVRAVHVRPLRQERRSDLRHGGVRRMIEALLHSPVVLVPDGLQQQQESGGDDRWVSPSHSEYADLTSFKSMRLLLSGAEGDDARVNTRWLLRYGPYVDELHVMWFKTVELALGSVINLVGGIVTDSCFVQGFVTLVLIGAVLAIMVVKRPLAVRAQQLTTTMVYASMFVATVVAVVNLFVQDASIQDVASVLLVVSSSFTMLQTATDMLASVVALEWVARRFVAKVRGAVHLKRRRAKSLTSTTPTCWSCRS